MKATEFCYWLQGYFEISKHENVLSIDQVNMIKNHLNMVFIHDIDPSYPDSEQKQLYNAHAGNKYIPTTPVLRC